MFLIQKSFKISNVMHYLKETNEGKAEVKSVTEQWVEEGIEQGRAEGKAEVFVLLYKKGHISLDVATEELGVSKEEFLEMVSKDEQPAV